MAQRLPMVIPIYELKNTAHILETCKDSDVPIIVTKNGYAEMVLLSIPLYEKMTGGADYSAPGDDAVK